MRRRPVLLLTTLLAACAGPPQRQGPPVIGDLATQTSPAVQQLLTAPSTPSVSDSAVALENYRKLVAMNTDPAQRAEALRRIADLQVQQAEARGVDDPQSAAELSNSIAIYQQLLHDYPQDRHNDSVLKYLARAYEDTGKSDDAIAALQRLEREYPRSPLAPEAHFQCAQLLFSDKHWHAAELDYRAALNYGRRMWYYDAAQYKYAWALFKQSDFDDAIGQFLDLLDRTLPAHTNDDPDEALARADKSRVDVARDSLRAISISFSELGGAVAISSYFKEHPQQRLIPLIYTALGKHFLDLHRYADAAQTYAAFIAQHPRSAYAPVFQSRIIAAYAAGGFTETVIAEKERYVRTYAPDAPYWTGRRPTATVMNDLHRQLEDVAHYHHAVGQHDPQKHRDELLAAADWYRRILRYFPHDPQAGATNLALADALLQAGDTRAAADEYTRTAYQRPRGPKSQEAAYAAVQTYQRYADQVPPEQKNDALKLAAAAGVRLADSFRQQPQRLAVLTRAAQDYYKVGDRNHALAAAAQVEAAQPPAPPDLQRAAYAVTADSEFGLGHYAQAEAAYSKLLSFIPETDPARKVALEQLAASIYKQAAAQRAAGHFAAAARGFDRVGQITPTASIRATADYDAAAAYVEAKDWGAAEKRLQGFAAQYPDNPLSKDIDKKLAVAYQNDHKPAEAAQIYAAIAQRPGESTATRQDAAWLAAQLYDQSHQDRKAIEAYKAYVSDYPQPFDRMMTAQQRLADLYRAQNDPAREAVWLRRIIAADAGAGAQRDEQSRALAARAHLEIGRMQAQDADAIALRAPIAKSLERRKKAMAESIASLTKAADAGFVDVATAATYELGQLYHQFSDDLLHSERPPGLKGDEAQQYELLLEEQAEPFDEKAVQTHEVNLQRLRANVFDPWVAKSVAALAQLAPAQFGKHEQKDMSYGSLR